MERPAKRCQRARAAMAFAAFGIIRRDITRNFPFCQRQLAAAKAGAFPAA
jgi:hypothetical protein